MIGSSVKLSFDAKEVQRGLANLGNSFRGVGNLAIGMGAVGVAGAAAVAGIGAFAYKINAIGEDAILSDERLKNITRSMGIFGDQADKVSASLLDFADVQGRLLGIDDDTIALTESKLLTFKELAKSAGQVGGAFERATMAALDMSAAGFGEAESNAVSLGKALNDPIKGITALGKAGITFTAEEKKMIASMMKVGKVGQAQDLILKAIETQVGGTAKAIATNSSRIKVSLGQVIEAFAKPFSTGFDSLPGSMEKVFPQMISTAGQLGEMASNAIADAIAGDVSKFVAIGTALGAAINAGIAGTVRSSGENAVKGTLDFLAQERLSGIGDIAGWISKQIGEPLSLQESIKRAMEERGVSEKFISVKEGNQGFVPGTNNRYRYAGEGESSVLSDAAGNKVIEVLQRIENNTKTGSKM